MRCSFVVENAGICTLLENYVIENDSWNKTCVFPIDRVAIFQLYTCIEGALIKGFTNRYTLFRFFFFFIPFCCGTKLKISYPYFYNTKNKKNE